MESERPKVLVVDDLAEEFRDLLVLLLDEYEVVFAERGSAGLRVLHEDAEGDRRIFAVLLDNRFEQPEFAPEPLFEGREILRQIQDLELPPLVVMISAFSDTDTVIECVQAGAFWYLTKPLDPDRVRELVKRAHTHWQLALAHRDLQRDFEWRTREANLRRGVEDLPLSIEGRTRFGSLLGGSERMQTLYRRILQLGPTDFSVLVLGEPGTEKEAVAREVHRVSPRRRGPFGTFPCHDDPEVERQLFGWRTVSPEGRHEERPGFFEAHAGGTVLLREVQRLDRDCRRKLLKLLREGRTRRVGEGFERPCDVRVLVATEEKLRDLQEREDGFEDLLARVAQDVLVVPALRDRASDLPLLAEHFLAHARTAARGGEYVIAQSFDPAVFEVLREHSWPGNLEELEAVVAHAARRATTARIPPELVVLGARPQAVPPRAEGSPALELAARCYEEILEHDGSPLEIVAFRNRYGEEVLREVLRLALEHTGHKGKAAGRLLGWIREENEEKEYAVFRRWLTRLGVQVRQKGRAS